MEGGRIPTLDLRETYVLLTLDSFGDLIELIAQRALERASYG